MRLRRSVVRSPRIAEKLDSQAVSCQLFDTARQFRCLPAVLERNRSIYRTSWQSARRPSGRLQSHPKQNPCARESHDSVRWGAPERFPVRAVRSLPWFLGSHRHHRTAYCQWKACPGADVVLLWFQSVAIEHADTPSAPTSKQVGGSQTPVRKRLLK